MGVRETTKNAKVAKVRLGDVLSVKARIGWQGLTQKEHQATGEYNLVTGTDFREGKVDFNRCVFVGKERYDQDPNIQLRDGDILITKDGTIGKVAVVEGMPRPATLNSGVFVLRDISGTLLVRYLYHYFLAPGFRRIVDGKLIGCTISHLNQKVLVNLPIPVRSLSEQMRIAEELDRICALKKNAEERLALMGQLVKSRFVEMFGDTFANPMKWETRTFREASLRLSDGPFGSNLKSSHYSESGVRVIRLGNIGVGEFLNEDQSYVPIEHYEKLKKYTCRKGELVFGTLGEPNLRACLIPEYIDFAVNKSDCVHYIPRPELLDNQFVCSYVNSAGTLRLASSMVHGQTRTRVSSGQIAELPIFVPPMKLQREFAAFVAEVDKSKSILRETVAQMETLYKAKLQEYFG